MAFQKAPHLGDLAQVLHRDGPHCEALLSLGDDEAVGGKARQTLAHRVDGDVVAAAQGFQFQSGGWAQTSEDNVLVEPVAQRFGQGRT